MIMTPTKPIKIADHRFQPTYSFKTGPDNAATSSGYIEKTAWLSIKPSRVKLVIITITSKASNAPRKICKKGCFVDTTLWSPPACREHKTMTNIAKNQYLTITIKKTLYSRARY